MRLLKVGGKLSGGENVWWQCVEKDGKTVYLQIYPQHTVNGRNPAPVGNFQDSYETLKILG